MLIDNMQFDFMSSKGTIDAIFIMQHIQHQTNKLYYAFKD